jgi:hypothetical protein
MVDMECVERKGYVGSYISVLGDAKVGDKSRDTEKKNTDAVVLGESNNNDLPPSHFPEQPNAPLLISNDQEPLPTPETLKTFLETEALHVEGTEELKSEAEDFDSILEGYLESWSSSSQGGVHDDKEKVTRQVLATDGDGGDGAATIQRIPDSIPMNEVAAVVAAPEPSSIDSTTVISPIHSTTTTAATHNHIAKDKPLPEKPTQYQCPASWSSAVESDTEPLSSNPPQLLSVPLYPPSSLNHVESCTVHHLTPDVELKSSQASVVDGVSPREGGDDESEALGQGLSNTRLSETLGILGSIAERVRQDCTALHKDDKATEVAPAIPAKSPKRNLIQALQQPHPTPTTSIRDRCISNFNADVSTRTKSLHERRLEKRKKEIESKKLDDLIHRVITALPSKDSEYESKRKQEIESKKTQNPIHRVIHRAGTPHPDNTSEDEDWLDEFSEAHRMAEALMQRHRERAAREEQAAKENWNTYLEDLPLDSAHQQELKDRKPWSGPDKAQRILGVGEDYDVGPIQGKLSEMAQHVVQDLRKKRKKRKKIGVELQIASSESRKGFEKRYRADDDFVKSPPYIKRGPLKQRRGPEFDVPKSGEKEAGVGTQYSQDVQAIVPLDHSLKTSRPQNPIPDRTRPPLSPPPPLIHRAFVALSKRAQEANRYFSPPSWGHHFDTLSDHRYPMPNIDSSATIKKTLPIIFHEALSGPLTDDSEPTTKHFKALPIPLSVDIPATQERWKAHKRASPLFMPPAPRKIDDRQTQLPIQQQPTNASAVPESEFVTNMRAEEFPPPPTSSASMPETLVGQKIRLSIQQTEAITNTNTQPLHPSADKQSSTPTHHQAKPQVTEKITDEVTSLVIVASFPQNPITTSNSPTSSSTSDQSHPDSPLLTSLIHPVKNKSVSPIPSDWPDPHSLSYYQIHPPIQRPACQSPPLHFPDHRTVLNLKPIMKQPTVNFPETVTEPAVEDLQARREWKVQFNTTVEVQHKNGVLTTQIISDQESTIPRESRDETGDMVVEAIGSRHSGKSDDQMDLLEILNKGPEDYGMVSRVPKIVKNVEKLSKTEKQTVKEAKQLAKAGVKRQKAEEKRKNKDLKAVERQERWKRIAKQKRDWTERDTMLRDLGGPVEVDILAGLTLRR